MRSLPLQVGGGVQVPFSRQTLLLEPTMPYPPKHEYTAVSPNWKTAPRTTPLATWSGGPQATPTHNQRRGRPVKSQTSPASPGRECHAHAPQRGISPFRSALYNVFELQYACKANIWTGCLPNLWIIYSGSFVNWPRVCMSFKG